MNDLRITAEDLERFEQIARVSSRGPALGAADFDDPRDRWTELGLYFRAGSNRPFVAVVEGKSSRPGERDRFQWAAMGTLERAVNWFEGSKLRDELIAAIPEDWQSGPAVDGVQQHAPRPGPRDLAPRASASRYEGEPPFYRGEATLSAALEWLYPGETSDRARAIAFEKDFAVPERTTRNTLAIEAGRVEGKVGPWLAPFIAALRYFDKRTWERRHG